MDLSVLLSCFKAVIIPFYRVELTRGIYLHRLTLPYMHQISKVPFIWALIWKHPFRLRASGELWEQANEYAVIHLRVWAQQEGRAWRGVSKPACCSCSLLRKSQILVLFSFVSCFDAIQSQYTQNDAWWCAAGLYAQFGLDNLS